MGYHAWGVLIFKGEEAACHAERKKEGGKIKIFAHQWLIDEWWG